MCCWIWEKWTCEPLYMAVTDLPVCIVHGSYVCTVRIHSQTLSTVSRRHLPIFLGQWGPCWTGTSIGWWEILQCAHIDRIGWQWGWGSWNDVKLIWLFVERYRSHTAWSCGWESGSRGELVQPKRSVASSSADGVDKSKTSFVYEYE